MTDRVRIFSGAKFEDMYGYSRAVGVGDRVIVSGTAAIWPDGTCEEDPGVQATRCLEIIEAALSEAGASLADVVRTRMFVTEAAHSEAVGKAHAAAFADTPPATSMIVVSGFIDERWKVEIEAEAVKTSS